MVSLPAVHLRRPDEPSIGAAEELRALLQTRLRVISAIIAIGFGADVLLSLAANPAWLSMPSRWFTEPPYVAGEAFVVALFAVVWRRLGADRRPVLEALRRVEALALVVIVGLVLLQRVAIWRHLGEPARLIPRDLGEAQAAIWLVFLFTYGTLIPNTWRRALAGTVGIALAAFIPDLWALGSGLLSASAAPVLLGQKAILLGFASALAVHASYRAEVQARETDAARRLGQYRLLELLGSGGMGEVWRAEHRMLRRPSAIKLIHPDQAGDAATLARFEREVQATAGLSHPNTVQVFDYGRADDGTFYCVMEYLPGETLDARLAREGVFAEADVIPILRQLCGSLSEAHAAGLVHRDIKPGNVMLCERGGVRDVVKLLDFGLVLSAVPNASPDAEAERLTQAGMAVGTPSYMAPEQCAGTGEAIGPATDVYALGALAMFLLTGSPPFAGRTPMQVLAAHLYETPVAPSVRRSDVSREMDELVLRCLAKETGLRFGTVLEMDETLRRIELRKL